MKIKTKLLVYILLTNFIRDGISTADFKCDTGYKLTKGSEEFVKDFSENTCTGKQYTVACFSAKGSFVIDGSTCELLNFFFNKIILEAFNLFVNTKCVKCNFYRLGCR